VCQNRNPIISSNLGVYKACGIKVNLHNELHNEESIINVFDAGQYTEKLRILEDMFVISFIVKI